MIFHLEGYPGPGTYRSNTEGLLTVGDVIELRLGWFILCQLHAGDRKSESVEISTYGPLHAHYVKQIAQSDGWHTK